MSPLIPKRRTLRRAMLALVAFVGLLLWFIFIPLRQQLEWARVARQMDATIRYLKPTEPNAVGSGEWDCAHAWVVTAYCNICFSTEHTTTAEMYRLRDDLDRKLTGPVNLETLKWIWDRLGETGHHGKQYTEHYEPSFRDCFFVNEARRSSSNSYNSVRRHGERS